MDELREKIMQSCVNQFGELGVMYAKGAIAILNVLEKGGYEIRKKQAAPLNLEEPRG